MEKFRKYKIAIVHEWFVDYSGSEKVVEQILNIFPHADLYSLVDFLSHDEKFFIKHKNVHTSFIQKLPFSKKIFRAYLPLFPYAIENLDLSTYDIVISSNHCVSKGFISNPNQLHICICYSPMRYIWDQYFKYNFHKNNIFKKIFTSFIFNKLRIWDVRSSYNVDYFVSISNYIAKRIQKVYRRESEVIYPFIDLDIFKISPNKKESFYLTSSRLVEYKKISLIVEAFTKMPHKQLVVIGSGPEFNYCKKIATKNISLLGYQDRNILIDYMQRAQAFIFASEEDFGISPLEAQACGTPVIAFKSGGAVETLGGGKKYTHFFFKQQNTVSLIDAIKEFETNKKFVKKSDCRSNAEKFSKQIFINNFKKYVSKKLQIFFGDKN